MVNDAHDLELGGQFLRDAARAVAAAVVDDDYVESIPAPKGLDVCEDFQGEPALVGPLGELGGNVLAFGFQDFDASFEGVDLAFPELRLFAFGESGDFAAQESHRGEGVLY